LDKKLTQPHYTKNNRQYQKKYEIIDKLIIFSNFFLIKTLAIYLFAVIMLVGLLLISRRVGKMKKLIIFLASVLLFQVISAQSAVFIMNNGKKITGKITKIEAGEFDGKSLFEANAIAGFRGTSDLNFQISDIKEINLKKTEDVSCFEDGRFVPLRKFCSMRMEYTLVLKNPGENKDPVELSDNRLFIFHIEGEKEPLKIFFSRIQVSNEGKEDKTDYPDLEREVVKYRNNGVKKITFK